MNQYCLNLLKRAKYIIIQRLARKYRNKKCRFHFGKFFTTRSIIAQPLKDFVPDYIKRAEMKYRNTILKEVKYYIDNELNPKKKKKFSTREMMIM